MSRRLRVNEFDSGTFGRYLWLTAATVARARLGHHSGRAGSQAIRAGHVTHDQRFEAFFGGVRGHGFRVYS